MGLIQDLRDYNTGLEVRLRELIEQSNPSSRVEKISQQLKELGQGLNERIDIVIKMQEENKNLTEHTT